MNLLSMLGPDETVTQVILEMTPQEALMLEAMLDHISPRSEFDAEAEYDVNPTTLHDFSWGLWSQLREDRTGD